MPAQTRVPELAAASGRVNARLGSRLLAALAAASVAGAVVAASGHAWSARGGATLRRSDAAAMPPRLAAIRAEAQAALGCAGELRALARASPGTTAAAVHVERSLATACAGDDACLARAAIAAVDERAGAVTDRLAPLGGIPPDDDPAIGLAAARAHATVGELCADRDVATTLARAPRRPR